MKLPLLARLRRVSERHRIINLYSGNDWLRGKSEVYAFEHFLMHQAFYRRLSPHERLLYHREIARILQSIAGEYVAPPRKLLLDIAHHCQSGEVHLDAARHFQRAAESSYLDGAAVEAAELCQEAITNLTHLPEDGAERDRLMAESVLLHLTCISYGAVDRAMNLCLLSLAQEGEKAAERAGIHSTLAQIKSLTGHLHIRSGNVVAALAVMREGAMIAKESGNRVTEFFVLAQLGRHLAKESLEESMALRYEAREVFEKYVAGASLEPAHRDLLLRQFSTLLVYIGLGELDRGDYEKAVEQMERGIEEMRNRRMSDDLLAGLNYLGQAYALLGLFEEAERVVKEAIELQSRSGHDGPHPWTGYNLGLLGKIYMEGGRIADAVRVMADAVQISEAVQQADLLTLVRNYEAELLMHTLNPAADLARAERVLMVNLAESRTAALHRSAALALSLLALLRRKQGRLGAAATHSTEAIEYLERHGDMPALRTEEILFSHHLVLRSLGREDEAVKFLARSRSVLQRKARRLQNRRFRTSFLRAVPLSRNIIEARRSGSDQEDAHAS
jgi:tetratricopeptide (TPR) repeat protein